MSGIALLVKFANANQADRSSRSIVDRYRNPEVLTGFSKAKKAHFPPITDNDLETIVSVTREKMDKLVEGFESGDQAQALFYERFEGLCEQMLFLMDRVFITIAVADRRLEL